jgi:uncharacterized protein with PQ loop repeat
VPQLETLIGAAAAFCPTIPLHSSAQKMVDDRRDRGSVAQMLCLLAAGLAFWLVYGFMRADFVIMLANGMGLLLLGTIVYFKVRQRE